MPCKLNWSSSEDENPFQNSHFTVTTEGFTSFISSSLSRLNFEAPGESKTYSMTQTPKSSHFHIYHLAKLKIKELFSFQQSPARLIASLTNTYPMKRGNQSMITDKWWELKCVTDLNSCSICQQNVVCDSQRSIVLLAVGLRCDKVIAQCLDRRVIGPLTPVYCQRG